MPVIQFIFIIPFMPLLALWIWWNERHVLKHGWALSELEQEWAGSAGVKHPEQIRVMMVDHVPLPIPRSLSMLAHQVFGLGVGGPIGLCLRYGIYIEEASMNPTILVHECVHTAQYERFGIFRFLWYYLLECTLDGYAESEMERDANETAARVLVRQ